MDPGLADLVERGLNEANPWWKGGGVSTHLLHKEFRRHAFQTIYDAIRASEQGRGVVVLGPRRVGKTVLLNQVVQQLLDDGIPAQEICLIALDDVALRGRDLGDLLTLIEARRPIPPDRTRILLLDEIQHSPDWSGWLKRIAERRDPYTFLATGSSATALRRGGQDAGLGRWREMTLFPWSFREHVELRGLASWSLDREDRLHHLIETDGVAPPEAIARTDAEMGPTPPGETERLDAALVDYFLRGGFPEVARAEDLAEARRRLRYDILDRALGRDILDMEGVDPRALERLFLRVCLNPGGLWSDSEASRDIGISRPTVVKYMDLLERAFLIFRFPNLASPVKGQEKVYLVAPSLRQALLGMDEAAVRQPGEWGRLAENCVAAAMVGTRPDATQIGFWRKGRDECDVVVLGPDKAAEFLEVKRSGRSAVSGIRSAMAALKARETAMVLARERAPKVLSGDMADAGAWVLRYSAAVWLYRQSAQAGGTLRIARL